MEKYVTARQTTDDNLLRHRKDAVCRQEKYCQNTVTFIIFNVIIVKSSTKYFVPGQQFQGEQLLHFHADNEHFYIVDNYIYINNNKQERQCTYRVFQKDLNDLNLVNFTY